MSFAYKLHWGDIQPDSDPWWTDRIWTCLSDDRPTRSKGSCSLCIKAIFQGQFGEWPLHRGAQSVWWRISDTVCTITGAEHQRRNLFAGCDCTSCGVGTSLQLQALKHCRNWLIYLHTYIVCAEAPLNVWYNELRRTDWAIIIHLILQVLRLQWQLVH